MARTLASCPSFANSSSFAFRFYVRALRLVAANRGVHSGNRVGFGRVQFSSVHIRFGYHSVTWLDGSSPDRIGWMSVGLASVTRGFEMTAVSGRLNVESVWLELESTSVDERSVLQSVRIGSGPHCSGRNRSRDTIKRVYFGFGW